jgi:hypothetical protein
MRYQESEDVVAYKLFAGGGLEGCIILVGHMEGQPAQNALDI